MIKGIVFDMDGVLIDAREWHYQALNEALEIFGYQIDLKSHLERFDGLPTRDKLNILSDENDFPVELHRIVNEIKQVRTLRIVAAKCYPLPNVISTVSNLAKENLSLGVATNSIRETTMVMLDNSKLTPYFSSIVTNTDVKNAKPDPEIYLTSCQNLELEPAEVLVIEDNKNGIRAALAAGCKVHRVENPSDVHLDQILELL